MHIKVKQFSLRQIVLTILLIVMLLIRPTGLFGEKTTDKV